MPTIVSLFDKSGVWSQPYVDAGYTVHRYDLALTGDIMDLKELPACHGVLAAPPCTHFSSSGSSHWKRKDKEGVTAKAVALVNHTLDLIFAASPVWWALENPVGRIERLCPRLSAFQTFSFHPHWYGDPYTKKTVIWGTARFPRNVTWAKPDPLYIVNMTKTYDRAEKRSRTPPGFAHAFFNANP